MNWPQQPPRTHMAYVSDSRLQYLFALEPLRYATITEYATASGLDVGEVLEQLETLLDAGTVTLETVGDEVFVSTKPTSPYADTRMPANLWEMLRMAAGREDAYSLWRLVRGLEWAGWRIVVRPERANAHLSGFLSIDANGLMIPVLPFPPASDIADGRAFWAAAGEPIVALSCTAGGLEDAVTATRRHLLTRAESATTIMVLEAPAYQPTILEKSDAGVAARHTSREAFEQQY